MRTSTSHYIRRTNRSNGAAPKDNYIESKLRQG